MERRQAWLRDYLIDLEQDRLPFVGSVTTQDNPKTIAHGMRSALGLVTGWAADQPNWTMALRELLRRIEEAGIMVVVNGVVGNNTRRTLDVQEFRGFVLVDEYCPLLFVNGADGKAAQVFTLAHELAHIWFGSSAAFDLRELQPATNAVEQYCNRVAAEFLIPEGELRDVWANLAGRQHRFQQVARRFKVSELVAMRRALDLALITKNEFLSSYEAYLEEERRLATRGSGGDFYATQNYRVGRRFARAVVDATRDGRLLYHEAYQLTGLHGDTFAKYAESLDAVRLG